MNIFSRRLLSGALFLILLLGACNLPATPPDAPVGTIVATLQTQPILPTSTTSDLSPTAFIPITGLDVVSLQCQFCVNDQAHAVLIMSNQASFNVEEPSHGITCASAQEVNGRRILLCRGAQQSTFTLNVCLDASNCLQFPVTLQPCPLIPETGAGTGTPSLLLTSTPFTPVYLTPINTLIPSTSKPRPTQIIATPPLTTPTSPTVATTPQSTSTPGTTPVAPTATSITVPTATAPSNITEAPAPTAVPTTETSNVQETKKPSKTPKQ